MKNISVICPFFNEQKTIPSFFDALLKQLETSPYHIEIVCVNDGSTDNTLQLLIDQKNKTTSIDIVILDLSRNFGKEAALTAGIENSTGDAVIPIDTDLQDPPELIATLLTKWEEGYEVVLATRQDRSRDNWFKRTTGYWFYRTHNAISHPKIPENTGDFRLMDRCVVNALQTLPENQRFMKGLFNWVGFKTTQVFYNRPERIEGETKFTPWKLWKLAVEGITSFSTAPLVIWTYLGLLISSLAFFYGLFIIAQTILYGVDLPGYASLIVTILFLGGLQMVGMGILGEYIGRIYIEAKRRPIYIIRKIIN